VDTAVCAHGWGPLCQGQCPASEQLNDGACPEKPGHRSARHDRGHDFKQRRLLPATTLHSCGKDIRPPADNAALGALAATTRRCAPASALLLKNISAPASAAQDSPQRGVAASPAAGSAGIVAKLERVVRSSGAAKQLSQPAKALGDQRSMVGREAAAGFVQSCYESFALIRSTTAARERPGWHCVRASKPP